MDAGDNWTTKGASIFAPEQLARVKQHLENVGFVVILWWHYRGASAPTRLTYDDFERFEAFLRTEPSPGDAIDVWAFPDDPDQRIAAGKIPNDRGEVPTGGYY